MIGYPNDKPVPSSWIKSGTFTAAPGSRYEHNLDVIPGDSGAGTYDNADNRCQRHSVDAVADRHSRLE